VDTDTFTYDGNGNMEGSVTGGVTRACTYDIENRLTRVQFIRALSPLNPQEEDDV